MTTFAVNNLDMSLLATIYMMGPWQIVLIVLALLLLFGGKKIPELMRGLGSGIKEFKEASKDDETEPKDKKSLK